MNSMLYLRIRSLLLTTFLLSCVLFSYAQDTLNYRAVLTGRSEVMPVLTGATGEIQIRLAGNQMIVSGEFNNLSSNVLNDGINIHTAFAGQTGSTILGIIPSLSGNQRSGTIDPAINTFTISTGQAEAFVNRDFYLNVATANHPDGEIRGQIIPDGLTLFYANAFGSNESHCVLSRGHASVYVEVVSSSQMIVTGSFNNMEGDLTDASLYIGIPGEEGTVEVQLTPTTTDQRTGTFELSDNLFTIDLDQIIALGERRVYLNIKSSAYTDGELRGQLVPAEAGVVFRTHLSGTNIVPNAVTQAGGNLVAEVYGDSLMILSGTYENLSSNLRDDPLSSTGIYAGLAGSNGNETLPLNPTAASPTNGVVEATRNIYLLSDEESDLLFGRALYLSIASENYPKGELRGQLIPEAQAVFTGFMAGAFQVPVVNSTGAGNSVIELRGNEMTVSGSFQNLESPFASNSGLSTGLAGTNGAALFVLDVATFDNGRSGSLDATENNFQLSDAQVNDLFARRLYMSIASGAAATPELRAQILPEATAYFVGTLSGTSETNIVNSSAVGQTILEVHDDKTVLTGSFNNLESDFNGSIGAHIHNAIAGQDGAVANALTTDIANNNRNGTFAAADNTFSPSADELEGLFAREQYVNVHSIDNQSGAIRGQLLPLANAYFTTTLGGFNTVKPLESLGTGSVKFDLIGNTLTISGSFVDATGTVAGDDVALHIGAAGVNGEAAFILFPEENGMNGVLRAAENSFELADEEVEMLRSEGMYISITSSSFPNGELRGQLLPEPNFFPTGSLTFTLPEDGTFWVTEGDPTARFTAEWAEGVDNNNLYYIFQTSEFLDFREIEDQDVLVDAPGVFEYRLGQLDSVLMAKGLEVGDTLARYYRMVASDGALTTTGQGNFTTFVRGVVQSVTGADLELYITGPTGPYEQYSEIPYQISVVNNGPARARDITVDLEQPEGMVYTRSNATTGRYNLFFENWKINEINPGDTAVMNLTLYTLIDDRPIDFFIEIQGSLPNDPDSRPFNGVSPTPQEDDEAVFTIFPQPRPMGGETADLRLDIQTDSDEFLVFSDTKFTITLTNDGPDVAANIRVSALFPEGMVFTEALASLGEYNVVAQDWYVPLLASGESETLELTLFSLIEGRPLILFSQVIASDQFDPDSTPANDIDNVPDEDDEAAAVIIPEGGIQGGVTADLELNVEVDRENYERFENYTYTFTITNNGPDAAANIFIDAQLPDSLAYTSKAASIGDWNNFFQYWFIPYLESGAQHTLKLVLFTLAEETTVTYFTQVLSVDQDDPDSTPGNNQNGIPREDDESSVKLGPENSPNIEQRGLSVAPSVEGALYPSPATSRIYLNLHADMAQTTDILLLNMNGQVLQEQQTKLNKGLNQLQFNVSQLPDGIYYVGLKDAKATQQTWKFVKVGE